MKNLEKELIKVVRKRARELKKHFKYDGWPVRESWAQTLLDAIGKDLDMELLKALGSEYEMTFDRFGLLYKLKRPYEVAYYHDKTNRIIVLPNSKDDIDKYREANGYHWLGRV